MVLGIFKHKSANIYKGLILFYYTKDGKKEGEKSKKKISSV